MTLEASRRAWVAWIVLALVEAPAHAQRYDDPETDAALCVLDGTCPESDDSPTPPKVSVQRLVPVARPRGIALARRGLVITITAEASLGRGAMLEPTSIAPDVSYGLTDRVTLSLVHSGFATTGFRGSAGGGFCMTGEARECARVYNNAGVEALVDLVRGRLAIAAVGGIHAVSFDPRFIALKAGAQATYRAGSVTATLAPSILVGVTERERGNEGTVFAPASVGTQLTARWFAAVGGGVATPLDDVGGGWTLRLGGIVRYQLGTGLFVSASLFLPKLVGGDAVDGTGLDERVGNLWFTYAR